EADVMYLEELRSRLGVLTNEEGDLLYALAELPYAESVAPNFYLQIVLDREQFIDHLNEFTLAEGGSCWRYPEIGWFLEDTEGVGKSEEVLEAVQNADGMEEVRISGENYLVNTTQSAYFGQLIQYCAKGTVLKEWEKYTWIFYGFMALAAGFAVLFSLYTERLINRPLRRLYEAFQDLQEGDMEARISHSSGDEFEYIYEGFNHMVRELQSKIEEVYEQKNLADRAELKQLQAQISPHFLYNSFFLFSGRVGREDYEGARELADYLGVYFRYLTRNTADIVALANEMEHAEAYARIQESRFSQRIQLLWEPLPEMAGQIRVPRLIIQPILENAYKHGLEDKAEDGILCVRYAWDEDKGIFQIIIEDNGNAEDALIQKMRERLSATYQGEVTGMVNIHRRLQIYFKQEGGLHVAKSEMGGVFVAVKLPYETGVEAYDSAADRG
ncbi:MAG: histidine kinase, partial [Muribaculum sp.]|nr:histidine kinase [Muribaculum sp.]